MIITSELLRDKFQALFGAQYEIRSLHAFNEQFTRPKMTPYGLYDIEYQCFEEYADKIIGVVQVQPQAQNFTAHEYAQVNFTLSFWVPLNFVKQAQDGTLIEPPKFDFFADVKRVDKLIRGKEISAQSESDDPKRMFLTINEPILTSGKEVSGTYDRVVYAVNGTASVCDESVNVGKDCVIAFVLDGKEVPLDDFRTFAIGSTTDANSVQLNNVLDTVNEPALKGRQMTFYVDDVKSDNAAFKLIEDKAFGNIEIINETEADPDKQRQVHVKVYKRGEVKADFWGNLSAQYNVSGGNGFGSYQVVIVDGGKGEDNA